MNQTQPQPTNQRCNFPKQLRLLKNEQFRTVIGKRKRVYDPLLKLYAAPNSLEFTRIGISVSRTMGSAVVRNRFKRLVRESFRLNKAGLPKGFDIVVIPGPATRKVQNLTLAVVQASLVNLAALAARK